VKNPEPGKIPENPNQSPIFTNYFRGLKFSLNKKLNFCKINFLQAAEDKLLAKTPFFGHF
jgi:hypothetical protein